MIDLLFWFLVSQTISSLPDMSPGTEVRIVSHDLLSIYASASVDGRWLIFNKQLEPGQEVRLLILKPGASAGETVDSLGQALFARISPEGDDILVQFVELDGPLSFKKWLLEERGIRLRWDAP